jgi:hypothetical protein
MTSSVGIHLCFGTVFAAIPTALPTNGTRAAPTSLGFRRGRGHEYHYRCEALGRHRQFAERLLCAKSRRRKQLVRCFLTSVGNLGADSGISRQQRQTAKARGEYPPEGDNTIWGLD